MQEDTRLPAEACYSLVEDATTLAWSSAAVNDCEFLTFFERSYNAALARELGTCLRQMTVNIINNILDAITTSSVINRHVADFYFKQLA